jgi:hypothetical protein
MHDHSQEAQPVLPWPFPEDQFPENLGAAVHKSVLSGRRPALQVIHGEDGAWGVADAIDQPDDENLEAAHIWHVIEYNPSVATLATLAPGYQADRRDVGEPWVMSPLGTDTPRVGIAQRLRGLLRRLVMPGKRAGW